ncbi:hypothetical protein CsSME_00018328 [Camellia sinensis var. sinensis]
MHKVVDKGGFMQYLVTRTIARPRPVATKWKFEPHFSGSLSLISRHVVIQLHRSIRTDRFLVRPYRLSIDPNDLAPLPFVGQAAFVQKSNLHWK